MALKTYSPKDVNITVTSPLGGSFSVVGYADGEFITLTPNADRTSEVVGADGTLGITKVADLTGTITLTLMQNSPTNDVLGANSAFIDGVDSSDSSGLLNLGGSFTFAITDPSGSVQAVAANCHLKRIPDITLGADQNTRQWTFYAEYLVTNPASTEAATTSKMESLGNAILGELSDALGGVLNLSFNAAVDAASEAIGL